MELHSLALKALADASVRSLVLALAALAAMWLARARAAAVRHAVWTAMVCAMLLLPVLSVALPSIPLRILPAAPQIALAPAPFEVSGPTPIQTAPVPAPPRPQRDWASLALPVWLLVASAFLGRLVFGYAVSRRLLRGSAPIRDPRVSEALERLGAIPAPALAQSESISVPFTVGWIEPSILLPPGWRDWDRAKMDAVLAHELAHVRRSDWLVAVLAGVNRSVFWFHPLAWWMERRLTALAEEACDESSLAATGNRKRYAEVLLEMAEAVRTANGRLTWHAVAMARRSQVRQRIETILDESRQISRGMTKPRWAAVLLCGVPLVYGAAALQVQPAQGPEPKLIHRVEPEYPPLASQSRIQGQVHLKAKLGQDGRVSDVQVVSGHPLLVSAAVEAVKKWIYEPGMVNGEPVETVIDIDVDFKVAPQPPGDSPTKANVGGNLPEAKVISRVPPVYPRLARLARVTGTVRVETTVGVDGRVRSAAAISGPPLLRQAAVEAIRQWVYAPGRLNGVPVEVTTQVDVGFTLPDSLPLALTVERSAGQLILKWNRDADVLRDAERATLTVTDGDHTEDVPVDERMLRGGSVVYAPMTGNVQFRLEVVSREGKIVSESLTNTRVGEGSVPGGTRSAAPPTPARIRVSGNVQAANILYKVDPVYPPLARRARVQGTVRFTAIIGADGHVQNLQLISGHPLLVQAAREAVGQWVYRPVLLNGEPIERPTQIDVPFTLPEIR